MHLFNLRSFLFFIGFFVCGALGQYAHAYTDKPVMVNVNISRQSDTMGFNIVYEIQNFFYQKINDGQITLYDSPKKTVRISPASLAAIESSSGMSFQKGTDIFIHEFWTSSRKRTTFTMMGITFINQNTSGGSVSFGYVDLSECWNLIAAHRVECNVNGPASLTLSNALYSRNYNFNVVQFGKKSFHEKPEEAIKIRDKAFFSSRKIEGIYTIPKTKDIQYVIHKSNEDPSEIGNILYYNIEQFLNNNREVLFNIGGSRHFDYKSFKSEVAVTRIESNEIWEQKDGYIQYTVQSVTIFVNNKKLDPVSLDVIFGWGILYNFKTIEDVLKEKKFNYTLTRLNSTYVPENDSPKFLKSLEKYSWSQVSRYVKFYN